MKHVRNDGKGPLLAYGHELAAGQTIEMSDDDAARLKADPHVQVTVSDKPAAGDGEGQHDDSDPTKRRK